jgi:hypothetical protein
MNAFAPRRTFRWLPHSLIQMTGNTVAAADNAIPGLFVLILIHIFFRFYILYFADWSPRHRWVKWLIQHLTFITKYYNISTTTTIPSVSSASQFCSSVGKSVGIFSSLMSPTPMTHPPHVPSFPPLSLPVLWPNFSSASSSCPPFSGLFGAKVRHCCCPICWCRQSGWALCTWRISALFDNCIFPQKGLSSSWPCSMWCWTTTWRQSNHWWKTSGYWRGQLLRRMEKTTI